MQIIIKEVHMGLKHKKKAPFIIEQLRNEHKATYLLVIMIVNQTCCSLSSADGNKEQKNFPLVF